MIGFEPHGGAATDTAAKRAWDDVREFFNPRHHPILAWMVLGASLMITFAAWQISYGFVTQAAEDRFQFETDDIKATIAKRMQDQAVALRGGVGLFAASTNVTRQEWRAYVDSLELEQNFPGLQGFGYSVQLAPGELQSHIESVRAEGFADFSVGPEGDREMYSSILFLEPFDWRNKRAFGYDMFSESTRREAMERARDTGKPAVSGAVTLVQETDTDVQHGFLMYVPVYRNDSPTKTVAQRRQSLVGYVYSPFRMDDLMAGVLGAGNRNISFEVLDSPDAQAETALYHSHENDNAQNHSNVGDGSDQAQPAPTLARSVGLTTGGRKWTLKFATHPGYISGTERSQPFLIAAGGVLIDILVFLVISSVSRQRVHAVALAKNTTDKLRNQTARTNAIVDTMLDGVVTIDERGIVGSFNPAATTIFGYSPGEVIGMNVDMLMPKSDGGRWGEFISRYLRTGQATATGSGCEVSGVRKDGSTFPMDLSITPMLIDGSKMFTGVMRDITERKRMDRLKNEFVAVVSHELRTPLTALISSVEVVRTGVLGKIPDEALQMLDIAQRNGERLSVLINDILDIEKIEGGHMEFRFEPADIVSLSGQAIAECGSYANKMGVQLRFEHEFDTAMVVVDSARFIQVMSNLLSNAAKFTPKGNDVLVRLTHQRNNVRVAVIDQGPGILSDMHAAVFEKFRQLDSSDTRQQAGTGLGLSIAQAIILRHGGEIRINSVPGHGSEFYFDLQEATAKDLSQSGLSRPESALAS